MPILIICNLFWHDHCYLHVFIIGCNVGAILLISFVNVADLVGKELDRR